jgi:hypothetical protein
MNTIRRTLEIDAGTDADLSSDAPLSGDQMRTRPMANRFWKKWTLDKPAALGDWLWDVFVVQLAARLDRLTLREVIAFIPVLILIFAYMHRIPIPPELMLLGDLLAYVDVFAMIFLLSMIGRAGMALYIVKRAVERSIRCVSRILIALRRLDFRHRRANSAPRRGVGGRTKTDDDGFITIAGFAPAY